MVLKNNYLNNVIELQDNDDDSTHNNERETKFKKNDWCGSQFKLRTNEFRKQIIKKRSKKNTQTTHSSFSKLLEKHDLHSPRFFF